MDKITHGVFTPIAEPEFRSEEFFALFRAFNRMIHELEVHQEQLVQSRKIAAVGTLTSGIARELKEIPAVTPEFSKGYGLVAVCLERAVKKDSPQLQGLAQIKAPLLLVLR